MPVDQEDLTKLLGEMDRGVPGAKGRVYSAVYEELRRNASDILRRLGRPRPRLPGATLQTTALVNEAFIRFSKQRTPAANRHQFFGVFTLCMRRALLDHLTRAGAQKRGRQVVHVSFDPERDAPLRHVDLDLLLDALDTLEKQHPAKRAGTSPEEAAVDSPKEVVATLRLLMGWSLEEIATQLGETAERIERNWTFARAFVRKYLAESQR